VHLSAQHRDLMAQHQQFDFLGPAVAGELVNICSTWRSSRYTNEALTASIVPADPRVELAQPSRSAVESSI
jgi:hypothetical protein